MRERSIIYQVFSNSQGEPIAGGLPLRNYCLFILEHIRRGVTRIVTNPYVQILSSRISLTDFLPYRIRITVDPVSEICFPQEHIVCQRQLASKSQIPKRRFGASAGPRSLVTERVRVLFRSGEGMHSIYKSADSS